MADDFHIFRWMRQPCVKTARAAGCQPERLLVSSHGPLPLHSAGPHVSCLEEELGMYALR